MASLLEETVKHIILISRSVLADTDFLAPAGEVFKGLQQDFFADFSCASPRELRLEWET
jgi:hypothetical protein